MLLTRSGIFILSLIVLAGCAGSYQKFDQFIPEERSLEVTLNASPTSHIRIFYATCGMMVIEHNSSAIVFDPFFSYQTFGDFMTGIKSSKKYYERFRSVADTAFDRTKVKAAFIAHSHYDHLMDFPVFLKDRYFPNLKHIYGNEFVPDILHHFQNEGAAIHAIKEDQLYNPVSKRDTIYKWIYVSDEIEVLPIASEHAPQKGGVLVMNSALDKKYFQQEYLKDPYARTNAYKWDAGCNYGFLVKLKTSEGYLKILVQTSASNPPYGLPPSEEKADIAILCFASLQEVKDYPRYLVQGAAAQKLIFVHWEDFFRHPKNIDDVKLVRATNKRLALRRIQQVQQLPQHPEVFMPKPYSVITLSY